MASDTCRPGRSVKMFVLTVKGHGRKLDGPMEDIKGPECVQAMGGLVAYVVLVRCASAITWARAGSWMAQGWASRASTCRPYASW